jgi:hypothetical protein
VSVEVLAGAVLAHGGAGVGVPGGDLYVAQVDAGVEHGGDEGVSQHVWVDARQLDAGPFGEAAKPTDGAVCRSIRVPREVSRPRRPRALAVTTCLRGHDQAQPCHGPPRRGGETTGGTGGSRCLRQKSALADGAHPSRSRAVGERPVHAILALVVEGRISSQADLCGDPLTG